MPQIKNIATGEVFNVQDRPQWAECVWECGDARFQDVEKSLYEAVADYPKVGTIAFQMLFKPEEAITADSLKATDKVLASFWKLIDDPRTDVVDLGLQSVQNAIEYTLTAVSAAIVAQGGAAIDVPARKAAILSGVLK